MTEPIKLCDLPLNKNAVVSCISDPELSERLAELGFVENAAVKPVLRSIKGGVAAYEVMGAVFALRRCDTEKMAVVLI